MVIKTDDRRDQAGDVHLSASGSAIEANAAIRTRQMAWELDNWSGNPYEVNVRGSDCYRRTDDIDGDEYDDPTIIDQPVTLNN